MAESVRPQIAVKAAQVLFPAGPMIRVEKEALFCYPVSGDTGCMHQNGGYSAKYRRPPH
jgi:hypothetical protein